MAQITGGKIYYSQTRQATQFEPKKAEIELAFVVGEGESFEQIAKFAEDFAIAKVRAMIGATAAPAGKTVQAAPPKPAVDAAKPAATSKDVDLTPVSGGKEAYAAAQKAAPKTSVPKAGAKAKAAEEKPQITTNPENRVDPADMSATSDDDILGGVVEPVKVITDQDLTAAITKVNQKLQNAPAIRALVATFVQPPKGSRDIPQEQRADFLMKLDGLIAPKK